MTSINAKVSFPASVHRESAAEGRVSYETFTVNWIGADAAAAEKPCLTLEWRRPLNDIFYSWHTGSGFNRSLYADWAYGNESKLSSGCPVTCFLNGSDRNVYTVALSDCVTKIRRVFGVHEEDGMLICRVFIPLDGTGKTETYRVTVRIDETDCRYEDAIRAVSKWWETFYPPMPTPAAARETLYSFWYSMHQSVYAKDVEEEARRAAELGMKVVIVDDGWQTGDNNRGYAYCGDWQAAPEKIPDMRAHVNRIHEMGLKYVLWYSVPFIGKYADRIGEFREKTLYYNDRLDTYALDPRYPEVRAYLIGVYEKALKEWDLDGFKLDFIDSFTMTPETPAFREGMDFVLLEDAVHALMVDVMRALRAVKPDILLEFRQSYIGPVMREFGNMFRVGDCPNMILNNRVGVADLRLSSGETAVHSDMLMWHPGETVENAVLQIENVMFATVQISVLLDKLPEAHRKALAYWVSFLRENRELLLETPITAEAPQNLYPVIRAEKDGRSVIGCYQPGTVVAIPETVREAVIVNGKETDGLLLESDTPREFRCVVKNCMGEIVREEKITVDGIKKMDMPVAGLVEIKE